MPIFRRHSSYTGEWSGGRIQPSSLASQADSEVWLALPNDNEGEQVWEALNAQTIDTDLLELRAVPALAYGVRFGDRVSVVGAGDNALVVDAIRERSSFVTFRIWIGEDVAPSLTWRPLAEALAQLGCLVDVYSTRLIAVACAEPDVGTVRAVLEAQADASGLVWEQSA
ncbi:DUF4265 domain-containing protein [Herbiconiux ginsengi]|uniref:DUF4265 domain-containing protein n=1 Tax=Herbiconiux ginsengi TaxID=381665 RepID=UPI000B8351D1|nr:DUF4265 domain-containing protein [Herbiconiux ginsengi]